jgi:hypothetical protein
MAVEMYLVTPHDIPQNLELHQLSWKVNPNLTVVGSLRQRGQQVADMFTFAV